MSRTVCIEDLEELKVGEYFDFMKTRWTCVDEGEWERKFEDGDTARYDRAQFIEEYRD